jgi:hypothetical protein
VLAGVTFELTDLLGEAKRIDAGAVSFGYDDEGQIARLAPGESARVMVAVQVPEVPPGTYRGVIAARSAAQQGRAEFEGGPEDAWALLELEVATTDPRSPISPIEDSRVS